MPECGRFISEDPIGIAGGMNLYGYGNNNPLMYTDPNGTMSPTGVVVVTLITGWLLYEIYNKIRDAKNDYNRACAAYAALERFKQACSNIDLDSPDAIRRLQECEDQEQNAINNLGPDVWSLTRRMYGRTRGSAAFSYILGQPLTTNGIGCATP